MESTPGAPNANTSKAKMQAKHLREARRAKFTTLVSGLQSTLGQKRHFEDTDEEEAAEPLHKRTRLKTTRQLENGVDENDETEDFWRNGKRVRQQSVSESPLRLQERRNPSTDAMKSTQRGMDERKQHTRSVKIETYVIFPDHNVTTRPREALETQRLGSSFGTLEKKVHFEDEVCGHRLEKPTCFSNESCEPQRQTSRGSRPQTHSNIQREGLNQPENADVDMMDTEAAL